MATEIYKIDTIYTVDNKEIEITPLKIKYMREVMDSFNSLKEGMSEESTIDLLCDCVRISMKQYAPEYSKSIDDILDNFDLKTIYKILDISVGIKINQDAEESKNDQANEEKESSSWNDLDLAKLETEIFLLGIWKSYDELEKSISMPELLATLSSRRELDYQEKKFLAAMQGVDLDGENNAQDEGMKKWEDMKARVFSRGATSDSNDILALQGYNAEKVGFGIGMGLDYEKIDG